MKFSELLPDFAREIEESLMEADFFELAQQIPDVEFKNYTWDSSCSIGYIHLVPLKELMKELNIVEKNIIGVQSGKSIELRTYWVVIDIDGFDRITGIELLEGQQVIKQLELSGASRVNHSTFGTAVKLMSFRGFFYFIGYLIKRALYGVRDYFQK